MSSRLGTTMVSLHRELPLRVLVPRRTAAGRIEYTVETHSLRLPLKRADRDAFYQRITQPDVTD